MSLIRQAAKDTTKVFRVRIPMALAERLENIEKQTREAGLVFALNDAVTESLDKLASKAERELASLGKTATAGGKQG